MVIVKVEACLYRKLRFGRIGDVVHREQDVTLGRQGADSGDAPARLCSVTGASELCCSSSRKRAESGADAPRRRQ